MTMDRMEDNCRQPPPAELFQGIAQFNDEEWFDCHETLEELWIGEPGLIREMYQGILQIAVGLHHWREGNYGGAVSLMRKGVVLLGHVVEDCQGVDLAVLMKETDRLRERLEELGPERMEELERELIPRIRLLSYR
jgi:uncharacterized protein